MWTRRDLLKSAATTVGAAATLNPMLQAMLDPARERAFKIGACDWSIGKHSDLTAMDLARQIGLDGVQISMGRVDNDMHTRRADVRAAYLKAAQENGVQPSGFAIGELNNVPYKSDPRAEEWVWESIDIAKAFGVRTILLAFFGDGDIKEDLPGRKVVIERLKKVAPKAEDEGIVLGIESWLSAPEHMEIIEAVGSPNVKVYYDVANSARMGYDIYEEIRWLGKKQICEFHMKAYAPKEVYNLLLGTGTVDFNKVRQALDDIGYEGWMQIEASIPEGDEVLPSYVKNEDYLRSIFPERA